MSDLALKRDYCFPTHSPIPRNTPKYASHMTHMTGILLFATVLGRGFTSRPG